MGGQCEHANGTLMLGREGAVKPHAKLAYTVVLTRWPCGTHPLRTSVAIVYAAVKIAMEGQGGAAIITYNAGILGSGCACSFG